VLGKTGSGRRKKRIMRVEYDQSTLYVCMKNVTIKPIIFTTNIC
jgi:hypothetical protein